MGSSDKGPLQRIDELCLQAQKETDPAKIADRIKEIIRELDRLLDAVDESLNPEVEDRPRPARKRWVS